MKSKKIFIVIISLLSVAGIVSVFYPLLKPSTEDPLDDILQGDNYPYNGHYSADTTIITDEQLTQMIATQENVSKYAENISTQIKSNNTVSISCKLKNISELFSTSKELSGYQMWASAFEGQELRAEISIIPTESDQLSLDLTEVKVGMIALDPQLFTSLLKNPVTKELSSISYSSVSFADGQLALSGDCPKFLSNISNSESVETQ